MKPSNNNLVALAHARARELVLERVPFIFGDFQPTSRIRSPFVPDKRALISDTSILDAVAEYWDLVAPDSDLIGGAANFAVPLATALALRRQKPLIVFRTQRKTYHFKNCIDGNYSRGQSVLLIDDTIAGAETAARMVAWCQDEGLRPECIMIVLAIDPINRLLGFSDVSGVPVEHLITLTELFNHHRSRLGSQSEIVEDFIVNPEKYLTPSPT